jgi:flagellar biosynthesis protein FliP
MTQRLTIFTGLTLWLAPALALAQSNNQGTFGFFAAVTAAPFLLLAVTCFAKILIVLLLLRAGLSAQGVPPGSLLSALALALTALVMAPVITEIAATKEAAQATSLAAEGKPLEALNEAKIALQPLLRFMTAHTQPKDTDLMRELGATLNSTQEPWLQAIPAFMLSELRDAFRLGILVLLPFLALDLVLGMILFGLGVYQIEAKTVALPLKLLLLLSTDGLALIVRSLLLTYTPGGP